MVGIYKNRVVSLFLHLSIWQLQAPGCMFWTRGAPSKLSPWLHLQTFTSVSLPFFFFSFLVALPPLSCPTQWGRILLVAMTSGQCLYEMQPLTVWTAGQDRDTSRFKEELSSGLGRKRHPGDTKPQWANPDAAGWNGTLLRSSEGQHESLDGGTLRAAVRVVKQLLRLIRSLCGCVCFFHGGSGVNAGKAWSWESAAAGSRMGCDPWIRLED